MLFVGLKKQRGGVRTGGGREDRGVEKRENGGDFFGKKFMVRKITSVARTRNYKAERSSRLLEIARTPPDRPHRIVARAKPSVHSNCEISVPSNSAHGLLRCETRKIFYVWYSSSISAVPWTATHVAFTVRKARWVHEQSQRASAAPYVKLNVHILLFLL